MTFAHQQALRTRCAHPTGTFERFEKSQVEQSIPARFERMVRRDPRRLAVKTGSDALTYEALNQAANRVAHALLARALAGSPPVALLLRNGPAFVAASLGAIKAARVQVILDSTFPRARLEAMLEQSGAAVVITDARNAPLARELAGPRRSVLEIERLDGGPASDPELTVAPDTPLAIDYTSGSTGAPKGIVHTHRSVLHNVMRHANTFRIGPEDRHLALQPAITPPLYALLAGATTCPVDMHEVELAGLAGWLTEQEVTVYRTAVSVFRSLVDTLRGGEQLPCLRLLMVFGEPAYHTDLERYRKHVSDECVFVTSLGTRETGDYAYFLADKATAVPPGVLPGGYPVEDLEVLILDEAGRPTRDDRPGELAVRGPYAAVGYWGRPDLTRAVFLPDRAGERGIYRTGDLGRRLPDGCLLHLGRRDFQLKIRGHRVDVGEVETALLGVPGVKTAVVSGREDNSGDRRLVAYLVPSGDRLPSVEELRRALAVTLPAHMIPHMFVRLEALPLTVTGKIDRRALPVPGPDRPTLDAPLILPRSPLEEMLSRIWMEVLGLDRVGVQDGFLEIGGDSVLAAQVVSRVLDALDVDVPVRTLLEAPTIAAMATAIVTRMASDIPAAELDRFLAGSTTPPDSDAR
jgi:amino acid adenylation domain-containing protein